ncbi:MAG TPA: phosphoenolpyruvate synthase [Candidatus Polarisedimenticolia bacterium]|nr:phosphoenolpyruvate synthase [Candidatus Polarisedimenticolia bacterium]
MTTPAKRLNSSLPTAKEQSPLLWFEECGIADVPIVGGKNASLGEMIQHLASKGIRIPNGFATTAHAYRHFLEFNGLDVKLRKLFAGLSVEDLDQLRQVGSQARALILEASFPESLERAVREAYSRLCEQYGPNTDVAVRSSATAEDLPGASFAGQHETYLNVHGVKGLLEACKKCFASIFTDRAFSYRATHGFDHLRIALSIGVQKMVRSDLASSGVMFSIDTETGFTNAVLINASYGLGENIVQGSVNPDEYIVFKPTLKQGFRPVLSKTIGTKESKLIYDIGGSKSTKNVPVPPSERSQLVLGDDEILELARWACLIEDHYSEVNGTYTPMDMEWAKDGITQQIFIVQARPETVQARKKKLVLQTYRLTTSGKRLVQGHSVGEAIGAGKARLVLDARHMGEFQDGEILVTDKTDPDWEPVMKKAAAIVTNQGGRTCHAAIIARELGIPAIVGTEKATGILRTGQEITVSCAEGEIGYVYDGALPFEVSEVPLDQLPKPRTQILMNIGNPQDAFSLSAIPNDGVGLARLEFIIANHIQAHPMALIRFDEISDPQAKQQLAELTASYENRPQYFVEKLAQGVGLIAAAFHPKPVIVRLSDFKTNEYAHLLGGRQFEPVEDNPMIGWRGASRYYHERYREGFALECRAMKRVREEMGLVNVILMIPFCRTVDEGRAVLAEMAKHGLERGKNGLEIYVMCEIPSNVILADEFFQIFDGFSIGSNDLTQLTLGLDRDSQMLAALFDERNDAVRRMIRLAIEAAKRNSKKIGICGQAPSDYPEFARFLVEQGIDSISLNPDSVLKTLVDIAKTEKALQSRGKVA